MKFTSFAIFATAGSLVAAEGHHHAHRHRHKREPNAVTVQVPGPTAFVYQLDGKEIAAQDVCKGIEDGSLKWADGDAPANACSTSSATQSPSSTVAPAEFFEKPLSTSVPTSTPTSTPTSSSTSISSTSTSTSTSTSSSSVYTPLPSSSSTATSSSAAPSSTSTSSGATGIDAEFPDGELNCDTFPSDYGAVAQEYMGLGGWIGVQQVSWGILDEVIEDIVTLVSGQTCSEGCMCSYACPAGYQKSQWPSAQGATGQSVGGIQCKNGKLHKTNSASKTLCESGAGGVNVQNTLSDVVSVCRTDYPGTEAETVPLSVGTNSIEELTSPNEDTYYQWKGKATSAQYYLNPKGVAIEKACKWGDGSEPIGNWAPLNVGAGFKGGQTWLSIFPNTPTTNAKLDYNVKITGDVSQTCKYEDGTFYDASGESSSGCTVSVPEGKSATIVFY